MFEVNTTSGSLVMAKIAGTESTAKIMSLNSIAARATSSGVPCRTPFSITTNFWPSKRGVIGMKRRSSRRSGFFSGSIGFEGQKFVVMENGVRHGTPLLVALAAIEFSDIIFAVDSVPAIFAITKEPLVVFTSNIFAILGLRSMFFLLAGVVHKFRYLKYGLGIVLIFVGLKMSWLNEFYGGKFPITWSLGIIAGVLGASVAISLLIPAKPESESPTAK